MCSNHHLGYSEQARGQFVTHIIVSSDSYYGEQRYLTRAVNIICFSISVSWTMKYPILRDIAGFTQMLRERREYQRNRCQYVFASVSGLADPVVSESTLT